MDAAASAADLPIEPRPDAEAIALRRALRAEHTMVAVRWGAVAFGVVQVLTFYLPYPPGVLAVALGLVAVLAAGNVAVAVRLRKGVATMAAARRLGVAALALDVVGAMGLVAVYTFDPNTAMFAVLYVLPLAAALRFQLRGALATMAVVTVLYTLREVYGALVYDYPFLIVSINFRMGIGFLIAYVAGQMAAQLVRDRSQLEEVRDRLEQSGAVLAATNAELAAANDIKDDFLAMTNHELRTPLTTVLGYTQLLRKRWDTISDERRREFVVRIEEQGQRLQTMVEELLTLSSAQAGALHMQLTEVELCGAIDEAIQSHGLVGTAFGNDCPPGVAVWADRGRLGQILINYLTNARKYGAPPISVRTELDGAWVRIVVEDEGPGVPEAFVPRLFDRFSQASRGDSRTAEGTGLGLAIVQQLAQAQGGDAWYEPRHPRGSRFLVRFASASSPVPVVGGDTADAADGADAVG
jgi:signal transduction histidine kinase